MQSSAYNTVEVHNYKTWKYITPQMKNLHTFFLLSERRVNNTPFLFYYFKEQENESTKKYNKNNNRMHIIPIHNYPKDIPLLIVLNGFLKEKNNDNQSNKLPVIRVQLK